ncbi:hypothetical protein [Streptomyces sp. NPDC057740]|uniref:hypothetical protein n=1 Tax=Streptomyces sp. NPDC057740 TaxID=3346234 RepID=UPI0036A17E07
MLRSLTGAGLYLGLVGVWGVALGSLLRSTASSITVLVGSLLILPGLTSLLPASWKDASTPYLPGNVGQAVTHLHRATDSLGPWAGLAVCAAWVALTLAGAAYSSARDPVSLRGPYGSSGSTAVRSASCTEARDGTPGVTAVPVVALVTVSINQVTHGGAEPPPVSAGGRHRP